MSSITDRQAAEAVVQKWDTEFPSLHPTVMYGFSLETFKEPADRSATWAIVELKGTGSRQETLGRKGQREYLRQANILVRLFGPLNKGSGGLSDLVASVRQIYEGESFGGISPGEGGASNPVEIGSNGRFHEILVVTPVTYNEKR